MSSRKLGGCSQGYDPLSGQGFSTPDFRDSTPHTLPLFLGIPSTLRMGYVPPYLTPLDFTFRLTCHPHFSPSEIAPYRTEISRFSEGDVAAGPISTLEFRIPLKHAQKISFQNSF